MNHLPWKILGSALLLAVIFDLLFFKVDGVGINILLMELAVIGVTAGLAYHVKHKIPRRAWIAAGFALAYAFTFVVWTSEIGLTLSGFGLFAANVFFILFLFGHEGKWHHPLGILGDTVTSAAETFFTRFTILAHLKLPAVSDRKTSVVRGVLVAIPILIIFFALFLGSDLILQDKATDFTNWLDDLLAANNIIQHLLIIGFVGLVFLLIYAAAFWKRLQYKQVQDLLSKFNIESLIILGSSSLLFLGFILFQAFYLFGGQAAWDNIPEITYSEYAVQGFNELAFVAVLVIGLILSLRYLHSEKTLNKFVRWFEVILLGETVLILFSAWLRLQLYVQQYDFTPSRLFGFWFFIVAAVLLVMLAVNILRKANQYIFIQKALLLVGLSMLVFTMSTPDALAVKLNLMRATEEEPIDPFPLFHQLSAEAYPIMNDVLNSGEYEFGAYDAPLTDYCDFVGYNHNNGVITSFRWDDHWDRDDVDDAARTNWRLQSDINRFNNNWNNTHFESVRVDAEGNELKRRSDHYYEKGFNIVKAFYEYVREVDWRSWNALRAQLPDPDEYQEWEGQASIYEIAEACGLKVGDPA